MSSVRHHFLIVMVPMAAILSAGAAIQDLFVGDLWLALAIQEAKSAPWAVTMEVATFIGRAPVLIALVLPLFAWSLWKRLRAEAFAISVALLSFGITPALKALVQRPRPTDVDVNVWQHYDGLGFPSGHAFDAIVLFGLLYYLVPHLVPWKTAGYLIRASSLLLILLIGISRVYLGAHWPSDVLGGFLYGTIMLALVIGFHGWFSATYGRRTEARL